MNVKTVAVILLVLTGTRVLEASPTGNWVSLTNDTVDAVGPTNGWEASYWDDGRKPHADADYRVDGKTIHTPKWGRSSDTRTPTNFVFGGNSLLLTNSATLRISCIDQSRRANAPIRVTVPEDGIVIGSGSPNSGPTIHHGDAGLANLFGKLTVRRSKVSFTATPYDAWGSKGNITSLYGELAGDSSGTIHIAGRSPCFTLRLLGDASSFYGKVVVWGDQGNNIPNELELGNIGLSGSIQVRATCRLRVATVDDQASVGDLTFGDGAFLNVAVDDEMRKNGMISVTRTYTQDGQLTICLTNATATGISAGIPLCPVLKLGAGATGDFDVSKIRIEPNVDAQGNKCEAIVRIGEDGSKLLYVGCGLQVGEDVLRGVGDLAIQAGADGLAVVSCGGGNASFSASYESLSRLLTSATFHLDATEASSIVYETNPEDPIGCVDGEGRPYVSRWNSVVGTRYMKKWSHNSDVSKTGDPIRRVGAYPTVQTQSVNGVARPYVDFGLLAGASDRYTPNGNVTGTTASALEGSGYRDTFKGCEYHIVHSDAHRNPEVMVGSSAWRPPLLGGTDYCEKPNRTPGMRGNHAELFTQASQTDTTTAAFLADGCISVDSCPTNYTYAPQWGDVHVYTLIPTNALFGGQPFVGFSAIGCDYYQRYGGQRLGELLIYGSATNSLSERQLLDAYLMKKWQNAGNGPQFNVIGSMRLANQATVNVETDFGSSGAGTDVGRETTVGTLAGSGMVKFGPMDVVKVGNLEFAFTTRETCEQLTTSGGSLILKEGGTLTVTNLSGRRRVAAGTYKLFTADAGADISAFDSWTVDTSALGVQGTRVYREGNSIYLKVPETGILMIVR